MGAEPKPWQTWKPSQPLSYRTLSHNLHNIRLRSPLRPSHWRAIRLASIVLFFYYSLEILLVHNRLSRHSRPPAPPPEKPTERVFIASLHWNDGKILESSWNEAVVNLVDQLGRDNVYVSVYESGSWDRTKDMLRALDKVLGDKGVRRNVSLSDISYEDEIGRPHLSNTGWVPTQNGKREKRRIPYLASLRNIHLNRLQWLNDQGIPYDRVLFLNDIVFEPSDVRLLLDTNKGKYAAACALDFNRTNTMFDTFAVRDSAGNEVMTKSWPFFRSSRSVSAMKKDKPVPVQSCWNGMVAMPTEPFVKNNVRFRAIPDGLATYHLEGSEWCLLHADNPLHAQHEVYINPRVRVGYSQQYYDWSHPRGAAWLSMRQIALGLWENRALRWFTNAWATHHKVSSRIRAWRRKDKKNNNERGGFCLVDEMQVLRRNGWAHV